MTNPFKTTEEDDFANVNQNDIMSGEDVTRIQDFFSQLGPDRPFIREYTSQYERSEDTGDVPIDYNRFAPDTERSRRIKETALKNRQEMNKTQLLEELQKFEEEESSVLGANYQEQEFAKAREQRAAEIAQEELTAVADYQQKLASGIQPVNETIDYVARAEKAYVDDLNRLNNERLNIIASPYGGTKAAKRYLDRINGTMQSLEAMHKLNVESIGGKAYAEAPMEVKEVYNNNFMGFVQNGQISATDAIRYASQDVEIKSKVQPMIDQLISQGRDQEAQELNNRVFGRERFDALGRPLPGREGGLIKQTNFGTYQYNTDAKIFDENLNNALVSLGVKRPEKPQDLFKPEEDVLKSFISDYEIDKQKIAEQRDNLSEIKNPEEREKAEKELDIKEATIDKMIESDTSKIRTFKGARREAMGLPTQSEESGVANIKVIADQIEELNKFVSTKPDAESTEEYKTMVNDVIEKNKIPLIKAKDKINVITERKSLNPGEFYAYQIENQPPKIELVPSLEIQRQESLKEISESLVGKGAIKIKGGYLVPSKDSSEEIKSRIDRYNKQLRELEMQS